MVTVEIPSETKDFDQYIHMSDYQSFYQKEMEMRKLAKYPDVYKRQRLITKRTRFVIFFTFFKK